MARCDLDGVILGAEGQRPKVIIPLGAAGADELRDQALAAAPLADLVEWRVDSFRGSLEPGVLAATAQQLREASGRPLIATVRTCAEGGNFRGDDQNYLRLVRWLAALDAVSLLDVEADRSTAGGCIAAATEHGTPVIVSHHEFTATPPVDEMVARLAAMEELGATICKLAVMAHDSADAAALLLATARRHERARVPLLTMAMGEAGLVSRVVGHLFGSCATFASLGGRSSAPGQPPVEQLRELLDALTRLSGPSRPGNGSA
ncbi:MAG: type I 3-dehydroquinate dehydratase [Propionibacterium sp.]